MRSILSQVWAVLCLALAACSSVDQREQTHRICTQDTGCTQQERSVSPMQVEAETEAAQIEALKLKAVDEPRAAFDLGLRYFRGDGVVRDSYQALTWMRVAAERGHTPAQLALGRFYLMGLEEMGPDPAEAESWLLLAAEKGDEEAKKLLAQAQQAKGNEIAYQRWLQRDRRYWMGYWSSGYTYYGYWRHGNWFFY